MSTCPICHDEVSQETGITTLICKHSYHLSCIASWLLENDTCPMCRAHVGPTCVLRKSQIDTSLIDDSFLTYARILISINQAPQ